MFDYLSKDEAEAKEIELIAKWKTQDRQFGYNVAAGGESSHGYVPTEEVRRKWSQVRTGMKRSDETKAKLAEASTRNYERCREALARAKYKPVNMYTADGVFVGRYESMKESAMANGLPKTALPRITDVCKGRRSQAFGYYWEYAK